MEFHDCGLWRPLSDAASGRLVPGRRNRAFPAHGVLGWDVVLTADGPIPNAVSANPLHERHERVAGTGVLDDALRPLWNRAMERARAVA